MPSGYAYAKSLRTVKTCVGSQFCRFGTQDSMGMGARRTEIRTARLSGQIQDGGKRLPAQLRRIVHEGYRDRRQRRRMGDLYRRQRGIKARLADSLCKVKTDEELIELCAAIMQYYRETGNYLERTSEWVERMGLDNIRAAVVEDAENRKALVERIEFALEQVTDPWKKMLNDEETRGKLFHSLEMSKQAN